MSWLPDDFEHPLREDLGTGHHLRPIRGDDVASTCPPSWAPGSLWASLGLAGRDALDDFVPRWLRERWGFSSVDYSP